MPKSQEFPQFIEQCRNDSSNANFDFFSFKHGEGIRRLFEAIRYAGKQSKIKNPELPHSFENISNGFKCKFPRRDKATDEMFNSVLKDYDFTTSKSGKNIVITSKDIINKKKK